MPDWRGETVVVLASGPSLNAEVCRLVSLSGARSICVNDAYRLAPFSDLLYSCDSAWWAIYIEHILETVSIHTRLVTCTESGAAQKKEKAELVGRYGLAIVPGEYNDDKGFCLESPKIHYGGNSGFQAVNLALHTGAVRILLCGFNMQHVNNERHFFGDHPEGLWKQGRYDSWVRAFKIAAQKLPPGRAAIYNCTPESALVGYPFVDLSEALNDNERAAAG